MKLKVFGLSLRTSFPRASGHNKNKKDPKQLKKTNRFGIKPLLGLAFPE
jgi:hypothetical protein